MTREEAKEIFLNRGFINGIYDGNKWREACIVISEWLKEEPRWIPVSERLPKENDRYLVTVEQGYVTTAYWIGCAEFWNNATAWMPLPKAYSEDK